LDCTGGTPAWEFLANGVSGCAETDPPDKAGTTVKEYWREKDNWMGCIGRRSFVVL
jgi:hypothetical protein